jgi:hypothetical protein
MQVRDHGEEESEEDGPLHQPVTLQSIASDLKKLRRDCQVMHHSFRSDINNVTL